MNYPAMFRLGQRPRCPVVENVPEAVVQQLSSLNLADRVKKCSAVAVACGGQRLANYAAIIKSVVDHLRDLGTYPFIVAAMGGDAHGTAEGRIEALRELGITREIIGAEIRASMETEIIGHLPEGLPVHCDKQAVSADHLVVANRVKPHPMFHKEVQGGLLEMLAIGLGNVHGAKLIRTATADFAFDDLAYGVHKLMLKRGNLLAGLMIVENGRNGTARVQGALPEEFVEKEKFVLQYSRRLFCSLPFRFVDVLLVDEIGTCISCLGADSNVTGRKFNPYAAVEGEFPQVRMIALRDLNTGSKGNAIGVGYAQFVRSRLVRKIDAEVTRSSVLMHGVPALGALPVAFDTDREILDAALTLNGMTRPEQSRVVWIRNTATLDEMECSEAYMDEVKHWKDLPVLSGPRPLEFNADGNLRDFVV